MRCGALAGLALAVWACDASQPACEHCDGSPATGGQSDATGGLGGDGDLAGTGGATGAGDGDGDPKGPDAGPDAGTQQPSGVKWHPGNYMYTAHPDDPAEVAAALASPDIVGIQVRYFWAKPGQPMLEPNKGAYDFSGLSQNLETYAAAGKRLHLLIFDQDYWGAQCVPPYMYDPQDPDYDPVYQGGSVRDGDRCIPKYWVPAVMDRILALYRALGERFDAAPHFEAISTHESAVGNGLGDGAYSVDAYVTQLLREQTVLVEAFPHTLSFIHLNWTPRLPELVARARGLGLGIDGPDLFVSGDPVGPSTWAYPCFNQTFLLPQYEGSACAMDYHGAMPLGMGGQVGLEQSIQAGHSMAVIYDFALRDPQRLRLTHMAWSRPYQTPGFTFDATILPHIEQVGGDQLNTACPQNLVDLRGGCQTD